MIILYIMFGKKKFIISYNIMILLKSFLFELSYLFVFIKDDKADYLNLFSVISSLVSQTLIGVLHENGHLFPTLSILFLTPPKRLNEQKYRFH